MKYHYLILACLLPFVSMAQKPKMTPKISTPQKREPVEEECPSDVLEAGKKLLQEFKDLVIYLASKKHQPKDKENKAKAFLNRGFKAGATVEIVKGNGTSEFLSFEQYFDRLINYSYASVDISFNDLGFGYKKDVHPYDSKLSFKVKQFFDATNKDGSPPYHDITIKKIDIYMIKKMKGWKPLIGRVYVSQEEE